MKRSYSARYRAAAVLALGAVLATSACAAAPDPRQVQIMDTIEARIRLPAGASALGEYARTYAFAADGRVIGSYFIPQASPGPGTDRACASAKSYGSDNGQIALLCAPPDGMARGQRRWYKDSKALPDASDGGCAFIDVEFDVKSATVKSALCHGNA